ncbi:hypothetical protein C7460_102264 [Marinoscillum furvescens DSM 4134]|uniref:Uncharacterized protein n=1 Tax=Marinoscillum furvescens DSM 4134 TaxID=1122208 RepID=A0A3D9L7B6_MARFU|nr:hypothetical protein C7460_102264 [Marinoscillum furvescens DSM 4134]
MLKRLSVPEDGPGRRSVEPALLAGQFKAINPYYRQVKHYLKT